MADGNTKDKLIPDNQENAGRLKDGTFAPGVSGNPAGRPKRKTLTELIHAKLDSTENGWEAVVAMAINKILKDGDKEILKTLWNYTDGMPNQRVDHGGDIKVIITDYGTDDLPTTETATSTKDSRK